MSIYMFLAGCLACVIGLIHSVLGEVLIFKNMRSTGVVPTRGGSVLIERRVRILWASWHVTTIFGWALAAILLKLSFQSSADSSQVFIESTIAVSMFASAVVVLIGTQGKHPGWCGLLGVALLVCFA